MPFLGSSRLAPTIDQFENIRAFIHGHAHRGETPGGMPVYNCAQMVALKETGRPFTVFDV